MLLRDCKGGSKNEMMEARNGGGWWLLNRGRVARDYILVLDHPQSYYGIHIFVF